MKKFIFCLFFLAGFAGMFAQKGFEGVIKVKSDAKNGLNATFTVKGNMVLMEAKTPDGKKMTMITDKESGDMTILSDENGQKAATKLNANDIPKQMKPAKGPAKADNWKVTVTDEKKEINGYECVKVLATNPDMEGEAWVAEDLKFTLADLFPSDQYLENNETHPIVKAQGIDGFVMKWKQTNLKEKETMEMEAEVKAKKIDSKVFEIPREYKVMDMSRIMEMMEKMPDDKQMDELRQKIEDLQKKSLEQPQQTKPYPENPTKDKDDQNGEN